MCEKIECISSRTETYVYCVRHKLVDVSHCCCLTVVLLFQCQLCRVDWLCTCRRCFFAVGQLSACCEVRFLLLGSQLSSLVSSATTNLDVAAQQTAPASPSAAKYVLTLAVPAR